MKTKIQFAVVLTDEKKTVLVVDNDGIYTSIDSWQRRFDKCGYIVLYASEVETIDITLSHYFMK